MDGETPTTLYEGLVSGLAHPVIGLDHLAFIVAAGLIAAVAGMSLFAPLLFVTVRRIFSRKQTNEAAPDTSGSKAH